MANTAAPPDTAPNQRAARWPLLLGLVLALIGAGAGFTLTFTGLLSRPPPMLAGQVTPDPLPDIAFVALDPITISLGPGSRSRHLRFSAQIEVVARYQKEVEGLRPRILDLLNGYLRAVDPAELEQNAALVRLRAQMLRRLQIITGTGRVRDLLITEFVLN